MSKQKTLKPVSLAIGATFVASMAATPMANAATANTNPFAMNDLHSSYTQVADAKCGGSMNTKDSSGMSKSDSKKDKSDTEGKCGGNKAKTNSEGKCGGSK